MVAKGHGLGVLEMGKAGHDGFGFVFGLGGQRQLQRRNLDDQGIDGVTYIELEVGGDLIIA